MKVEVKELKDGEEPFAGLHVADRDSDLEYLVEYIETERYRITKIPCYCGENLCYVDSADIYYVESLDEKLYFHTKDQVYESRKRLYEMERMLPMEFVRISRSAIMNMSLVKVYKPLANGLMLAEFANKDAVYISRKYLRELRLRIKEGNIHEK